jgi:ATP-grasp domain, R2K clade family 3
MCQPFTLKNMHWILQNNIFSETGWDTLLATLERFQLPWSEHKIVPFVGDLLPEPAINHKNVICIGAYSMRHIARRHGWQPGVFDLYAQDFEQQLIHWGQHMLNANSIVCRFEDAVFTDEHMFVRPTNDSKYFAGRIFSRDEFVPWQKAVCSLGLEDGTSLTPQTMIQLAKPITIYAEYRFWVVKGKIITSSLYKRGDRVIYSSQVDAIFANYVNERLAEWLPLETFVIDVCDTENGIKIVEINTLNASGFYAADVQSLVLALDEAYSEG